MRSRQLHAVLTIASLTHLTVGQNCNPITSGIGAYPPNVATPEHYFVDFTKQTSLQSDWTLLDSW
ncbi:hypothetical protein BU23DRAFT_551632 [Bimuria novae-zelandiae CBS 107.79]|uniref:Uncharacterized protein n=1 Tax=Bimuria novae-zelandiae CBS 107.79 TaxID=1447943 RepID=A0A6A5VHG7_9PLEO|nr:hypothetical protein BU23DRAFT_551632 [Bimuria novae-zelandiae CBS 107.79]